MTEEDALIEKMCVGSLGEAIRQRLRIEPFNELGPEEQALFRVVMRAALSVARPAILEQAARHFDNNARWVAAILRSLAKPERTND